MVISVYLLHLLLLMNEAKDTIHPLALSCVFHYEFLFIHPFSDVMGEWLDYDILLFYQRGNLFLNESQSEKYQEEYYNGIERCHQEGE